MASNAINTANPTDYMIGEQKPPLSKIVKTGKPEQTHPARSWPTSDIGELLPLGQVTVVLLQEHPVNVSLRVGDVRRKQFIRMANAVLSGDPTTPPSTETPSN